MRAYPKAVESYQKVRVVVSNIRARQMAQVPQLLQCSTVTPLLLIWLCTALIATVAEPYKVVDQSLKIDPMPKDENVSIVVPLQPHCGEEMETAITYVMHAAFITK
jgi:hypothetical protein